MVSNVLLDGYAIIRAVVNIEVYRKESNQDAQALTVAERHPAVSRRFSFSAVNVRVELQKCTGPISKVLIPSSLARDLWALSLKQICRLLWTIYNLSRTYVARRVLQYTEIRR